LSNDITVKVAAGQTYFIMGSISMGFFVGHAHLGISTPAFFEQNLPTLSVAKPLQAPSLEPGQPEQLVQQQVQNSR